ncbi:MAG: nucleotide sugar dehydrogenase [Chromatiales bacterium]|nr:nucleotide sugar dehydrogenase [Chromatiales bacterium]
MRISVFGLGYVGIVTAACLAREGHDVIGVDVNATKNALVNGGQSTTIEPGVGELVAEQVRAGRLRATDDTPAAIAATELSLIAVGTPSRANGALSLDSLDQVTAQIGAALRDKREPYTVVYRSTVLPGTCDSRLFPALIKASGRAPGAGLELAYNPEFLREGSSIADFYQPALTVVGSTSPAAVARLRELYAPVEAEFVETSVAVAESVKYLSNIYHALKISFANECGSLLAAAGVDAREAMDVFMRDERLNISRAYLRPGYAFGGSCLPKDLRAWLHHARIHDVDLPMLGQVLTSNERHIDRALARVTARPGRQVALFGLAFKAGTDDLRESPIVALAERLLGKGYRLRIHDALVSESHLIGANREFIEQHIPHLGELLCDAPHAALDGAEIIIAANADADAIDAIVRSHADRPVIDLQGSAEIAAVATDYQGICW